MRDEEKMKQIAGLVLALIQFYRPLMGDSPFRELNILEINDFGVGFVPAGTAFITRETFARVPLEGFAGLFVEGLNRRLGHESPTVGGGMWPSSPLRRMNGCPNP